MSLLNTSLNLKQTTSNCLSSEELQKFDIVKNQLARLALPKRRSLGSATTVLRASFGRAIAGFFRATLLRRCPLGIMVVWCC
ncbi:MAG: hypothetical protein F6K36_22330 [Symploca sp. SIO3C6]|uniref:Uncharacterized protein n=1 Tax=Symploca sp. SIO1C4 TaxID=2607765 RepID=A0A6B3NH96_9CYAN|nr:hypothetical protein [Symploca sp. SIO3C6]NER29011.1 hypothetical protein [Symploca sp. SIO1C4]